MELTKEAVNRCRCVGALRDFLCQAMDQINEKDKEIAQQKRKRCLALARWCFTKSNYHFVLARHGEDAKENNRRSILYSKWRNRWLKLAEKFKPNNSTAQ